MNPDNPQPENISQPPSANTPPTPLQQPKQAPANTSKGLAVTSLILSIVGFLTGWLGIGVIFAIIAIVLGIISLVKKRGGKGMSIAGIIISSLTLISAPFVIAISLVAYNGIQERAKEATSNTSETNNAKDSTTTGYTSTEHGFTVSFPDSDSPQIERSTINVESTSVPYTQYISTIDNGSKSYIVQVADLSTANLDLVGQERDLLDDVINGSAQSANTTLISSTNNSTFLGVPAAQAEYEYKSGEDTYQMFALQFIKNDKLYSIMTAGVDKATFDSFVYSFSFS